MATPTTVDLKVIHSSQQFSDSPAHHNHDADAIFSYADVKGATFLTGTEAGAAKANHDLRDAILKAAKRYGWAVNAHEYGEWVALNLDLADLTETGYAGPFIPGTQGLSVAEGAHAPRGIAWSTAKVPKVGTVTMGSVHYLTKRSMAGSKTTNQPLADGIAKWGAVKGKGKKLVLINGDMNMDDEHRDVFLGKPFTTVWDELGKYPATHGADKRHGPTIDVSASFNADGRVTAKSAVVLDDGDLQLYTDHFPLVAVYRVKAL